VSVWQGEVKRASRDSAGFRVLLARRTVHARKLLLATGVFDQLFVAQVIDTLPASADCRLATVRSL